MKVPFFLHRLTDFCEWQSAILQLRSESWSRYYPHFATWPPESFQDDLDVQSIHFVVVLENGFLVAANRVSIMNQIQDLPFAHLLNHHLYPDQPFAYFSKLVVHPEYRKMGFKELLDEQRMCILSEYNLKYGLGLYDKHRLQEVRFQGFQYMESLAEGIEAFFPYTNRSLQLMSLMTPNPSSTFNKTTSRQSDKVAIEFGSSLDYSNDSHV